MAPQSAPTEAQTTLQRAAGALRALFEVPDDDVALRAVRALVSLDGPEVMAALRGAMCHPHGVTRLRVVRAIAASPVEQPLLICEALDDPCDEVANLAQDALVRLGEGSFHALCGRLASDGSAAPQSSRCIELGDAGRRRVSAALAQIIIRVGVGRWRGESKLAAAVAALAAIGPAAVPVLCKVLPSTASRNYRDDPFANALVRIGPPALPAVCAILETAASSYAVGRAAEILGEIGDRSAVPPLCRILSGAHSHRKVALALGKLGDPRAVPVLCETVARAPDPETVWECLRALSEIPDVRAAPGLVAVLKQNRSKPHVLAALAAVEKLGAAALPAVEDAGWRNWSTHGAEAPGVLCDTLLAVGPQALPLLCDLISRDRAGSAFSRLIASSRGWITPAVCAGLSHPELRARTLAAEKLRRSGDQTAISPLMEALGDPEEDVRHAAALALEALAQREPDTALRRALPILTRLGSPWSRASADAKQAYRQASAAIEDRTANLKQLPLPAAADLNVRSVPIPHEGTLDPDRRDLPVASEPAPPGSAGVSPASG